MVPVYPREWAMVGLDTDVKCFNLLKFLYGHCCRQTRTEF